MTADAPKHRREGMGALVANLTSNLFQWDSSVQLFDCAPYPNMLAPANDAGPRLCTEQPVECSGACPCSPCPDLQVVVVVRILLQLATNDEQSGILRHSERQRPRANRPHLAWD